MEQKAMDRVYETVLSSPGMEEHVKADFRLSRRQVLLLSEVMEEGLLNARQGSGVGRVVDQTDIEELQRVLGQLVEKAGLSQLREKLAAWK